MTLKQASDILRPLGIVIKSIPESREYRVSFRQRPGIPRTRYEDTAYYTNDIDDAVATGRHMAAHVTLAGLHRVRHGNRRRETLFARQQTLAHTNVGRFRVHTGRTPDAGLETMVFDMKSGGPWGGTLVDSGTRHYRTTREALRGHSEIVRSMQHVARHYGDARNAAVEVRLALRLLRKDVARGVAYPHALAHAVKWYRLKPREVEVLRAWYAGQRAQSAYGSAELQPGRFYGYKGHQVWLDSAPGGGYFAMVQGTALQARGATQGEALKKLRDRLDAGAANYARRRRARRR